MLRVLQNRAEVMSQWLRAHSLSIQYLSMGPWISIPTPHMNIWAWLCISEQRQVESRSSWIASLAQTMSFQGSERPILEIRQKMTMEDTGHLVSFSGLHMCTHGHLHLNIHAHIPHPNKTKQKHWENCYAFLPICLPPQRYSVAKMHSVLRQENHGV